MVGHVGNNVSSYLADPTSPIPFHCAVIIFCAIFQVRNTVADFAVLIGILCSVGLDYAIGVNTPKLQVPQEFKVSLKSLIKISN